MNKPAAMIPHEMVARKAPHGEACTQCGVCCMATVCQVGQAIFEIPHHPGPCPALLFDGDRSMCAVVLEPRAFNLTADVDDAELLASVLLLMRSGEGCDCRINGESVNTEFHRKQDSNDKRNANAIRRSKKLWRIP